ncbi:MAG: lactate utilization protein [Eubacterium sp.]|nr:lactate utilization protein [Eubacterium sp.]
MSEKKIGDEFFELRNKKLAEKIIKGLKSRHMEGFYAPTREDALKKAIEIIPEGASVTWGGSMSAAQIGLFDAMKNGSYNVIDRNGAATPEEKRQKELEAYGADFFISSANAITEDGVMVNLDGNSNRVSAIAYGPSHVLMIIGMNKVVSNVDAAIERTRHIAAPVNAQRFDIETPCRSTGACADCKSPQSICCNMLITRLELHPDRMKVILVGEDLGF